MKKLNMRILSALLAMLMLVSSCPIFAVAGEDNNVPETTQVTEAPVTEPPTTEPAETTATDSGAAQQLCTVCGAADCTADHSQWCDICKVDACGKTHCDKCGVIDCTADHSQWCDICKVDACGKTHCDKCGVIDCTADHSQWCDICKIDACGKTHIFCKVCKKNDCGKTHVFCEICDHYDCGITHVFCETCQMYDCIVDGHGETVPSDAAEDPTDPAGADGSGEPAAPADNCPWCEDTLGEDGTVIHSELCNAAYAYNGAADVGKYAKLSGDAISYGMDVSANPKTDKTGKQFFSTDFEDNTILRITGWYWDSETTALWYRVGFYSGGAVTAAGWPTSAWILQKYTDPDNDYGVSLSIFSGCSVCGAPECEALHVFCDTCKIYDCGVDHDAKEPDSVSEDGGSDHSTDIGKYLKLNSAVSSFSVYNSDTGNTLTYVHDDFTGDAIMRVADWKIDDQGLWYLVEFYKGGIVESSYTVDFPANPWFLQTDGTAANAFLFMQCCATCGLPDCDGNHETETVPSVSHSSGITVSSDSGIPAGAEIAATDLSSVGDSSSVAIYNIKIMNGDEVWQPAPGETVRVSMPAPAGAETVNVFHFLEDPEIIAWALDNGKAYTLDLNLFSDDTSILANAILGYQLATGSSKECVAVEVFPDVVVKNGRATVTASGFSIFVQNSNSFTPTTKDFNALDGQTVYVRPGELIEIKVGTSWSDVTVQNDDHSIVQPISSDSPGLFDWSAAMYFRVSENAEDGWSFQLRAGLLWKRTITFVVKETIDYDPVTITILSHNYSGYPNELLLHSAYAGTNNTYPYQYYAGDGIVSNKSVYTTELSSLIDRNGVLHSSLYTSNVADTVYGIVDNMGVETKHYLTDAFDAIAADILSEYCANNGLVESNYKLTVYVVKYEAIGSNLGWYIGCKVELKNNFTLSYEFNEPRYARPMDHLVAGSKPNGTNVPTNGSDVVTTTVESGQGMRLKYTYGDHNYVATFIGWDTDPSATTPTYRGDGTESITMTGDTKLYAIWNVEGTYNVAEVKIQKIVENQDGNPVDIGAAEFSFTADTRFKGLTYTIYEPTGNRVSTGTFGNNPSFSLKNGQYVVISAVPNSGTAYTVTETIPTNYATANAVLSISVNETTNKTGEISAEFVNTINTYDILYNVVIAVTNAEGTFDNKTVTQGSTVALPTPEPVDTGFTFVGWDTDGNTKTIEYSPDVASITNITADINLKAVWDPAPHEIYYEFAGIPADLIPELGEDGGRYTQPVSLSKIAQLPAIRGYHHVSTVAVGTVTGDVYDIGEDNTIVMPNENVVVTLTYAANKWTITFDSNGGSMTPDAMTNVPYGTAVDVNNKLPGNKEGHTFGGWISQMVTVQDNKFTMPNGNVVLTAKWTPNVYEVTWIVGDTSTKVPYEYGATIVKPADPSRNGYTFTGWSGYTADMTMPAEELTFTAQWEVDTYTVTFDANGGTLAADATVTYTVEEGVAIPVPIRNGCTFNGWIVTSTDNSAENWAESYTGNQNLTGMYGNVTLTAKWSASLTVSIDNGTIKVAEDTLTNGTHTVAVGSYANTDIKFTPADGYRITGVTVTVGDRNVETTFNPNGYTYHVGSDGVTEAISIVVTTSNSLTVTFKSWDGTVLDTQNVTPGGAATAPSAPNHTGYSFTGWDQAFDNVTTDLVVTAQYSVNSYTVTWVYGNGTEDATVEVQYGATIGIPEEPEKVGHTFSGWSPEVPETMPAENQTFTAQWTVNQYTITWTDDEGNTLRQHQVSFGETPVYAGETPTKAATAQYTYSFTGWTPEVVAVTGPATYRAAFSATVNKYRITFVDEDGTTTLYEADFDYGAMPEYRADIPAKTGNAQYSYTFNDWDKEIVKVTGTATYKATYTETVNEYEVVFKDDDGSILKDGVMYPYGTLAADIQKPAEPTKASTAQYSYVFAGWSPEIADVTAGATYTATYTETVNTYTITWLNDDGSVIDTTTVEYGTVPTHDAPAKTADDYTYEFLGWTPEVVAVTEDTAYTATYDALFDFKATIDHGTISYNAAAFKELERKDVVKGSDVDTQMVFKPEAGYQIKSVSVNGVAQTVTLESDGSYIHTFENGMRAEEKLIEVVTEPIEVVINIQFENGTNLLEIRVQKYSDVLLAIVPNAGNSILQIELMELTEEGNTETTTVTNVSEGYIYTASGITNSVKIVVGATTTDVYCMAGSIDHGTVSLHYGDTTVTSKENAAGKYLPYNTSYTLGVEAVEGRLITSAGNTIFAEKPEQYSVEDVMNQNKVFLAHTEETFYTITYVLDNGSDNWQETAAHGNVVNLREAPEKSGYTFRGWWYDKDADTTVDGDELLAAGASFTMPNCAVTMTAQWLDSRLDSTHKVYVGINMSFHNSNGAWYHSLPQNEPAIIHGLVSVRAYKDTFETTTWYIQTKDIDGDKFTKNLPGEPTLYITEDVFKLESGYVNNMTTGGAEGIFDSSGVKTRACLKLSEADYEGIIQGWLDAVSYLQYAFLNTNLDWNAISKDAKDYKITPYVIKHQSNSDHWYIDMVIEPSAHYNITYKMNLDNGYTSEVEEFTDNTGYGQGFQAKLANPKKAVNADRPGTEPRFLGWWYDKNDNRIVDAEELYGAGELFTMPAKDVELVAQWEYPKRLKIVEKTGQSSDTFFFDVVGKVKNANGEDETVMSMTVSVQGNDHVIIDGIFAADYTVTERKLWSWTYETGTTAITRTVAADASEDTVFEFSKTFKKPCWLFDENHN